MKNAQKKSSGCTGGCPWCPRRILVALLKHLWKLKEMMRGIVLKTRAIGSWWHRIGPAERAEIIARAVIVVLVLLPVVPELAHSAWAIFRHCQRAVKTSQVWANQNQPL